MSSFGRRIPAWYWVVALLLTAWNAIGCYFWYMQVKLGADAMPGATDYDRALVAALPGWYNYFYAVSVFAGTAAGVALLARKRLAGPLFTVSLIALVVQFGYYLGATDAMRVKGTWVAYFPAFIIAVAACSVWFAGMARRRGWLG